MKLDVAIVGGGIAGLVAAHRLTRLGVSCHVFEASDSVGGRIRTAAAGYELGAEFIHGSRAATWSLVDSFGLETEPYPPAGHKSMYAFRGRLLPAVEMEANVSQIVSTLEGYKGRDISVLSYSDRLSDINQIAKSFALDKVARLEGADISRLSVKALSHERRMNSAGWDNFRIKGGYSLLVDRLAGLISGISINAPVTNIVWSDRQAVRLQVEGNAKLSDVSARRVLIAVPLTILQDGKIRFDPKLPSQKEKAISKLAMGHVTKVVLDLSNDPLPDFSYLYTDGTAQVWWKLKTGNRTYLVGYSGGVQQAKRLADLGAGAVDRSLTELATLFGNQIRQSVRDGFVVNWATAPWIFGAYSYTPIGAFDARSHLSSDIQRRLFFAGEACSKNGHAGTVSGAIESAMQASERIVASL